MTHYKCVNSKNCVNKTLHVCNKRFTPTVAARIASFPAVLTVPWHQPVLLPCLAVGQPKPVIQWTLRSVFQLLTFNIC